jgi:iron complex transport system permease protein
VSATVRRRVVFGSLLAALPVVIVLGIALGSASLPAAAVVRSMLGALGVPTGAAGLSATGEIILWSVRLPRVLLAVMIGGGLAVVGAALQSLFRNPMADAGLLGVGPGAALGAVIAVNLGWAQRVFLALPLSAFAGALVAVVAVYLLAHVGGRPSLHGLLLTGLAVSALAGAGTSILLVATEEFRVRTILFWLAGGLEGRGFEHVRLGAAFILTGVVALVLMARPLDVLSLGEDEAAALSLPVHTVRLAVFGLAALVAGPATALAGSVPFVGLVAPHALRPLVGGLARHLLPASFLGGAILVVVADLVARTVSDRLDLPLGSVTALVGAPYFLLALRGQEGRS